MKRTMAVIVLALLVLPAAADVTLTAPEQIRSTVGGGQTVPYDKIRTININIQPQEGRVVVRFELYSSTDNALPPYQGVYESDAVTGVSRLRIERLGVDTGITLTNPQKDAVTNAIAGYVAQVEGSMVSFGLVDGS